MSIREEEILDGNFLVYLILARQATARPRDENIAKLPELLRVTQAKF